MSFYILTLVKGVADKSEIISFILGKTAEKLLALAELSVFDIKPF